MNEGLRFLYNQILFKKKSITTSLCGSYGLDGYRDMHHVYLNWDVFKNDSSCLTIWRDKFTISLKDGEYTSEGYKL